MKYRVEWSYLHWRWVAMRARAGAPLAAVLVHCVSRPASGSRFMEAEAKLYDGDHEVPGAVAVEGLNISGDQKTVAGNGSSRSRVFGNGDKAKAELAAGSMSGAPSSSLPEWQKKFAYSPFKFFIKPDVLTRLDQDMRLDFKERFRVKVELKLYRDSEHRSHGVAEATLNTFEFAVKFNSNTRLFDVLRGGVWYYDPVVSGSDPQNTQANPFTAQWLNRLVDANGEPVDVTGIFRTRLSLTPGILIKKGTNYNGLVFSDDMVAQETNSFTWIGLDTVQQLLDDAMPKLRRQVKEGERPTRMAPLDQRFRKVFLDAPKDAQGRIDTTRAADSLSAYGYRMANLVNAMQPFTIDESGSERDLNNPDTWGKDPALRADDRDSEGRIPKIRISPVLNQHLKNGKEYNQDNVLVNYLVAYSRLQKQGTRDNGLYPINTMLTRDLVVGPMGLSVAGFEDQRKAIDTAILEFNRMPSPWRFTPNDADEVYASSSRLFSALTSQRVITDAGSIITGKGAQYNKGLGMLQLGLQNRWLPTPVDAQDPDYQPGAPSNPNLYIWAEKPTNLAYDTDPGFNRDVKTGVGNFLKKHLLARRVEMLVNGVQNVPEELEEAANHLQQWIDNKLVGCTAEPLESPKRTPVIAIYNASAKRYYGGNDDKDIFDGTDILRQKRDTALPNARTANLDAIKLIGTLKAVVETLWNNTYQVDFYQANLSPTMPRKVWYWPEGANQPEIKDLVMDALLQPPVSNGDGTWTEYALKAPIAPAITGQIDLDFPVNTDGMTEEQIRAARYRVFQNKNNEFWPSLQTEQIRLQKELENIQITLHAHSQGAIIAAAVQTRLGTVSRSRVMTAMEMDVQASSTINVASQIRLVSYGGGANMLDWGSELHYKSYAHHVNAMDGIAFIVGMHDPFQDLLQYAAPVLQGLAIGADLSPVCLNIRHLSQGSCFAELMNDPFNPHIIKVISGPSMAEVGQWANGSHVVVYHDSRAGFINDKEHNFVNGYKCAIGTEKKAGEYLPRYVLNPSEPTWHRWWWRFLNPNVVTGEMGCLYR